MRTGGIPLKVTAIVQARMGSTRLPGKVMLTMQDKTVLGHVITRLQRATRVDQIIVATSSLPRDLPVREEAERYQVQSFAGSEKNLLERFFQATCSFPTDIIVRINADCPLLDPLLVDMMVERFCSGKTMPDYLSNTLTRTFPKGLDVEIFTRTALEAAYLQAQNEDEQEHVTPFLYRRPETFHLSSYINPADYSRYRWKLETVADWRFLRDVYRRLYLFNPLFSWQDVLALLERQPELAEINSESR
ncbi:MAG: cytidylyltransferase domain-containing protein [Clostridia bacterium]